MIHALGSIKRKKVLFLTNSYELYHHGVKGMKWGVRKTKETGVGIYRRSIGLPGSKDEAIKNKGMNPAKRLRQLPLELVPDHKVYRPNHFNRKHHSKINLPSIILSLERLTSKSERELLLGF